jgi:hypothetical protein
MTWLRSPTGDCAYCAQPYSLHDSCTDACPGEVRSAAPGASGSVLNRERLIEAYRTAVELEPQKERKHLALMRMHELLGQRPRAFVEQMERSRGIER